MKKLMEGWREYERKVLTEEIVADQPSEEAEKDPYTHHDLDKLDKRKWWEKMLGVGEREPLKLGHTEIEGKPPLIGGSMDPDFDWRDSPVIVGHTQIDDAALSGEEFSTRYGFTRAEAGHDAVQDRLDYLDAHPDVWDETL